jgi:transcriptional regulator with XRE-family HTH domain
MPIDPAKLFDDGDIRLRVAAHLLAFMHDRAVSQNELARRAGVTSGRVSRFITGERGSSYVSIGLVMRFAQAIESTPSYILREPPPPRFYEEARRRTGTAPPEERTSPRDASRATVQAGKRSTGGRH